MMKKTMKKTMKKMMMKKMTVRKGAKRKRGHECDVCEKVFTDQTMRPRDDGCCEASLNTCVRTRKRNRTNVMCARSVLRQSGTFEKPTCVFTRTRDRTNVMCARSVLLDLVV